MGKSQRASEPQGGQSDGIDAAPPGTARLGADLADAGNAAFQLDPDVAEALRARRDELYRAEGLLGLLAVAEGQIHLAKALASSDTLGHATDLAVTAAFGIEDALDHAEDTVDWAAEIADADALAADPAYQTLHTVYARLEPGFDARAGSVLAALQFAPSEADGRWSQRLLDEGLATLEILDQAAAFDGDPPDVDGAAAALRGADGEALAYLQGALADRAPGELLEELAEIPEIRLGGKAEAALAETDPTAPFALDDASVMDAPLPGSLVTGPTGYAEPEVLVDASGGSVGIGDDRLSAERFDLGGFDSDGQLAATTVTGDAPGAAGANQGASSAMDDVVDHWWDPAFHDDRYGAVNDRYVDDLIRVDDDRPLVLVDDEAVTVADDGGATASTGEGEDAIDPVSRAAGFGGELGTDGSKLALTASRKDADSGSAISGTTSAGYSADGFKAEQGVTLTERAPGAGEDGPTTSTGFGASIDDKGKLSANGSYGTTRKDGDVTTERKAELGLDDDGLTAGYGGTRTTDRGDGVETSRSAKLGGKLDEHGLSELDLSGTVGRKQADPHGGAGHGVSASASGKLLMEDTTDGLEDTGKAHKESGFSLDGGVSADAAGVSLELGGGYSDTTSTDVAVQRNGDLEVTETDSDTWSGQLGVSSSIVGLGFSGSTSEIDQKRIVFYATAQGKAAWESYNATGELPNTGGYEVQDTTTGETRTSSSRFGVLGMSVTQSSQRSDLVTRTNDGHVIEQNTGAATLGMSIPFLGSMSHRHGLEASQVDGADQFYTGYSQVDDTDAKDAYVGLLEATGAATDGDLELDGDASGKWAATTRFSEDQVDGFAQNVLDNSRFGGVVCEDLRKALRVAGDDPDARRRALADFVAEHGDEALAKMRAGATLSGEPAEVYLELDGDPNWVGLAGHVAIEQRIAEFEARLSTPEPDRLALVREIQPLLGDQERKLTALDDRGKYPEVPESARRRELARTQEHIDALSGLQDIAVVQLQSDPETETLGDTVELSTLDTRTLQIAKRAMGEAYEAARKHIWVHSGGGVELAAFRPANERSAMAAFEGDPVASAAYLEGLAAYGRGLAARRRAADAEQAYFALDIDGTETTHDTNAVELGIALDETDAATLAFDAVSDALASIAAGREGDPLFAGYDKAIDPRW